MRKIDFYTEEEVREEFYEHYLDNAEFDAGKIGYEYIEYLDLYVFEDVHMTYEEHVFHILNKHREEFIKFNYINDCLKKKLTNASFRMCVSSLRDKGIKIISIKQKGYMITKNQELIKSFVEEQLERANKCFERYENWVDYEEFNWRYKK